MELKFETTLKCAGCEASVKPYLDALSDVKKWEVDLTVNPKVVTVEGDNLKAETIIDAIAQAGFKAELIS